MLGLLNAFEADPRISARRYTITLGLSLLLVDVVIIALTGALVDASTSAGSCQCSR